MTPRYLFMIAVLAGPFGCGSDPARGPRPEVAPLAAAPAAPGFARRSHQPPPAVAAKASA